MALLQIKKIDDKEILKKKRKATDVGVKLDNDWQLDRNEFQNTNGKTAKKKKINKKIKKEKGNLFKGK